MSKSKTKFNFLPKISFSILSLPLQKRKKAGSLTLLFVFVVVELHYALLRDYSSLIADALAERYAEFQVEIDLEIIKAANALKLQHRKRDLSAADVIGYATAQRLGLKFLTGDEDFKDMAGVEFVKK